jgi:hypothetical protein
MIKSQINLHILCIIKQANNISQNILSLSKDSIAVPSIDIKDDTLSIREYLNELIEKYIDIVPDAISPILYDVDIYKGVVNINYVSWIRFEYIKHDSNLFPLEISNFINDTNVKKLVRFL